MKVLLIGLSHKTAPIEVRERLDFGPSTLRSILTHFDTTHRQAHLDEVAEGVVLSTCNRMEVYSVVRDEAVATQAIIDLLSRTCETDAGLLVKYFYIFENEQAIAHLFRVACGLDSMVLGEPQILGQITDAYEAALSQKSSGTIMSALFRAAIHAGKRARTETKIGVNPSSISSVAASLAHNLLGDLTGKRMVLIGAGEMGEIAVRALMNRGLQHVTVVNRTHSNAELLAKQFGGRALTFQRLPEALIDADIVITSTGAPHTILDKEIIRVAMAYRPNRPLFAIDIAVPRDIDPDITELPNVYLRDIDDLQTQAEDNVQERRSEIPHVEIIVEEEIEQFIEWLSSLDAVATITDLRREIEEISQGELDRLFNKVELDPHEEELVAIMAHRLVNKILYKPIQRLKFEAAHGDGAAYTSTVRKLFDLDHDKKRREALARRNGNLTQHEAAGHDKIQSH